MSERCLAGLGDSGHLGTWSENGDWWTTEEDRDFAEKEVLIKGSPFGPSLSPDVR